MRTEKEGTPPVQLVQDDGETCEGDGAGAERARDGQRVLVLAVPGRVLEERRLRRGGGGGQEAGAPAAGVGEGDVERERECGEEVEQRDAQQLRLQHWRAPHAHPPHHPRRVIVGGGAGLLVGGVASG